MIATPQEAILLRGRPPGDNQVLYLLTRGLLRLPAAYPKTCLVLMATGETSAPAGGCETGVSIRLSSASASVGAGATAAATAPSATGARVG